MSVGILPGMGDWSMPSMDGLANATGAAGLGAQTPMGTTNVGSKLSLSVGANGTVPMTILLFAVLYFGTMAAWHALERFG